MQTYCKSIFVEMEKNNKHAFVLRDLSESLRCPQKQQYFQSEAASVE